LTAAATRTASAVLIIGHTKPFLFASAPAALDHTDCRSGTAYNPRGAAPEIHLAATATLDARAVLIIGHTKPFLFASAPAALDYTNCRSGTACTPRGTATEIHLAAAATLDARAVLIIRHTKPFLFAFAPAALTTQTAVPEQPATQEKQPQKSI